jgi:MFS family permease
MVDTPVQGNFAPWLVIAGPGLSPQGTIPAGVDLPTGDQAAVIVGVRPASADYEPFSPMAMYQTGMYTGKAPEDGTYVIAVYTPAGGGPYSLATGTLETFTIPEWIMVPVDLIGIRLWQGQSLLLIFGPYLAVLVIGTGIFILRPGRKRMTPAAWSGFIAGLVYLGSGAATMLQTGIALLGARAGAAVFVTLVFAAIALGAGAAAVSASIRSPDPTLRRFRGLMAVIGIAGIAAWAGVILGPVLAFASALIPDWHG